MTNIEPATLRTKYNDPDSFWIIFQSSLGNCDNFFKPSNIWKSNNCLDNWNKLWIARKLKNVPYFYKNNFWKSWQKLNLENKLVSGNIFKILNNFRKHKYFLKSPNILEFWENIESGNIFNFLNNFQRIFSEILVHFWKKKLTTHIFLSF